MESLCGRRTLFVDATTLAERRRGYTHLLIDVGTGDGRFVQHVAQTWADTFALGIDACREPLAATSRRAPANALYIIANAYTLPVELYGLATHITINFPWSSLRDGLLMGDATLLHGLSALAQPEARLDVRLNSSALRAAGWSLAAGAARIRQGLQGVGFALQPPIAMSQADLRRLPTTWAKRMAFGRDPHAMHLHGTRLGGPNCHPSALAETVLGAAGIT